ncbi:hypothetical protein BKA93DRAFT_817902 [Sparassis latifolia]
MAAPAEMTTLDMSGHFTMNTSLSDDFDTILRLQGVGWFTRKAIGLSTLHLHYSHYTEPAPDAPALEYLDVAQSLSGGIGGTCEPRVLDWALHPYEDDVFGPVVFRSRRLHLRAPPDGFDLGAFLLDGWADDVHVHGAVYTIAESAPARGGRAWRAVQVWGFKDVNGERRHARHIDFTGPQGERVLTKLVYDYHGPVRA